MSIEDPTISTMWEIAAIVELLEQKGLSTEQDLHTTIDELRRTNPLFCRVEILAMPEPSATCHYR